MVDGRALLLDRVAPDGARLDDRRVQVEVVRHHGRAEDADRDVKRLGVEHDLGGRDVAGQERTDLRPRHDQLNREADPDRADQRHHQRLDEPEALPLQEENQQHVGGG